MDIEQLVKNIAAKLSITDSEKEFAFRVFIEKVTEKISFDEALKIEGLGVFQLQKEPTPRQERTGIIGTSPREKRTLIYSPPFEKMPENTNSVFLTIDLENLNYFQSEDVSRKFNISVNPPLIPIAETDLPEDEFNDVPITGDRQGLEKKISDIVNSGLLLRDYDIWEEYMNRRKADDDKTDYGLNNEINSSDSPDEPEEFSDPQIKRSFSEFMPETQAADKSKLKLDEELKAFQEFAELEKKHTIDRTPEEPTDLAKDERDSDFESGLNQFVEVKDAEAEKDYLSVDNIKKELNVSSDDLVEDSIETLDREPAVEERKESSSIIDEINSNYNLNAQKSSKRSLFDELEKYLKDDGVTAVTSESLQEHNYPREDEMKEESENLDSGTKGEEELKANTQEEEQITVDEPDTDNEQPFYTKIWFIVSAILLVIIIVALFVFNPFKTDQKQQSAVKESAPVTNSAQSAREVQSPVEAKTTVSERTGLYRKMGSDSQVAPQVYFDGEIYTVQLSSWKSSAIAENEVEKYKKLGHDAFIYQVYLDSKKSTWNRVRIGYFNSLKEAQDFLIKNKF